jgi:hypothetical protein
MGKQTINVNLFPKTGYVFKDQNGVTHVGSSWAGVIAKVIAYRKRMSQPPGNAEAEVVAQACANNPAYCREETEAQKQAYRKVSIKGRVLRFLALAREHKDAGSLTFSQPQDAANRAAVCARCPFNQPLPSGCGACNKARKEGQLYVLGRQRNIDARLHGCLVLGEDVAVAAHLERVTVDNSELPADCWRKKTL